MKALFEEYGDTLFSLISGFMLLGLFVWVVNLALAGSLGRVSFTESGYVSQTGEARMIGRFEVADQLFMVNDDYDEHDYVVALNDYGEDISEFVVCDREFSTKCPGDFVLTYSLMYCGEYEVKSVVYHVIEEEEVPEGFEVYI